MSTMHLFRRNVNQIVKIDKILLILIINQEIIFLMIAIK